MKKCRKKDNTDDTLLHSKTGKETDKRVEENLLYEGINNGPSALWREENNKEGMKNGID